MTGLQVAAGCQPAVRKPAVDVIGTVDAPEWFTVHDAEHAARECCFGFAANALLEAGIAGRHPCCLPVEPGFVRDICCNL